MDLLEASASLERIELLAKISHFDEISSKEKTVALAWIEEIAELMHSNIRMQKEKKSVQSHSSR